MYALQARGLIPGEPLASSIAAMAADYLDQIREVQPRGPYRLLGWSFGGNVAHAVAARLHALGEEVALLALLDSYPPVPGLRPTDEEVTSALAEDLGVPAAGPVADLMAHPDGPLADFTAAERAAVAALFANDARLLAEHQTERIPGDLLHFTAAAATHGHSSSEWRPYVTGTVITHHLDADHHTIASPASLATIGRVLTPHL